MGYQLKITIKNSRPPIWRRIIVPEHITFADLDNIIEAAFGWTHDHMFAFKFGNWEEEFVGTPFGSDEDTADVCIDPWMEEGISFSYIYDFGDDWYFVIHVSKAEKDKSLSKRSKCIKSVVTVKQYGYDAEDYDDSFYEDDEE